MDSRSAEETPLRSALEGEDSKRGGGGGGERRKRTVYTKKQMEVLKKVYQNQPYPSFHMRERLALLLGLEESRIQVWFQNRRARNPVTRPNSSEACKRRKMSTHNPCPKDQPPAQNLSAPALSGPGANWTLSCDSVPNWDSDQQGGIYSHNNSFGAGLTAPTPQTNMGLDTVTRSMLSPLEGAGNLPMGQQLSQQATFCWNAQPDVNYFNTQQQMSWTHGNMQLGDQVLTLNYPYPVSPQTPHDMSYHMNYLNYNQAADEVNGSVQY